MMFASIVFVALGLCAGTAYAEKAATESAAEAAQVLSPTNAAIAAYKASFKAAREAGQWPSTEDRAEMANEVLADLDPKTLTVDEMDALLSSVPVLYSGHVPAFDAQLVELAQGDSVEAVRAASLRFRLLIRDTPKEQRAQMLRELLQKSGLFEAWKQGKAYDSFGSFKRLDPDQARSLLPALVTLGSTDISEMPATYFSRMGGMFYAFARKGDDDSAEMREPLRVSLVEAIESKLDDADISEKDAKTLTGVRDRLNGAFARGKLVGHTAPELNFTWWSNPNDADESFAKISDLKGKVVVLDFWATWCGPCIASFPNVKELQSYYEGYDVMIVGVTALQGTHYTGDDRGKIDCTDDPAKEMELMAEFMGEKDVTWRIAFAEGKVNNPDYGVGMIPHVVIIDPQGVVRYRGLHPAKPLVEKTSKINALLIEAGKPAPAPPVTEEEATETEDGQ